MTQIKITKYEQICVTVELEDAFFVFDPGSEASMDLIRTHRSATAAFVSHAHPDHFNSGNLRLLGCPVYGTKEVVDALDGDIDVKLLEHNSPVSIKQLSVNPFSVNHGPISAPIDNLGFHITALGVSILFLGDIKVASPIPKANYDVIFVPVGGSKVFDLEEAFAFIQDSALDGVVIPSHYHGRADRESGDLFVRRAGAAFETRELAVGESLTFDGK